ncbi:hypothetical protein [Iodobacter fluviatilis]|uniref:Uncharacterized protein n=1 Tax=Iodobacter fluviatilis TaxID=537 RepID=A0A7G3GAR5_9NEIS|nr:hypothetical protein [Iodobacter fluviatilis]QBC44477.1 hypothetical protein C1H71_13665 [Iodobacter fluviatilis]
MTFIQKSLLGLALLFGFFALGMATGWHYGAGRVQSQWDLAIADAEKTVNKAQLNNAVATVQVVTKYVDKVRIVREQGQTIIKEVPIYVTQENDAAAVINNGFVSVWNAANSGNPPDAPRAADAQTSGVKLSEVAEQHSIEAGYCREVEQQLTALQGWLADGY